MLHWFIRDVDIEIHVMMELSWLQVDFVETAFFMLHMYEFDVALALI